MIDNWDLPAGGGQHKIETGDLFQIYFEFLGVAD